MLDPRLGARMVGYSSFSIGLSPNIHCQLAWRTATPFIGETSATCLDPRQSTRPWRSGSRLTPTARSAAARQPPPDRCRQPFQTLGQQPGQMQFLAMRELVVLPLGTYGTMRWRTLIVRPPTLERSETISPLPNPSTSTHPYPRRCPPVPRCAMVAHCPYPEPGKPGGSMN